MYHSTHNSLFTLTTQYWRPDKTVFPISKFSVVLNIFETKQLQVGNWVKTRQYCLVLSPILFTPLTWTRQDKTVLFCLCRRCEQAITGHFRDESFQAVDCTGTNNQKKDTQHYIRPKHQREKNGCPS